MALYGVDALLGLLFFMKKGGYRSESKRRNASLLPIQISRGFLALSFNAK